MEKQRYENHVKYYPLHHFIFYPLLLAAIIYSAIKSFADSSIDKEWLFLTIAFIFIGWLSFMVRQHYALGNQNRIVRLEMRLRYYQLAHQRFEDVERRLSFQQLAALRFAGDDELLALIQRTLNENLSGKAIKHSIKNWLPDEMRV